MREIGVGVIGTGFMGRAHALAYRAVSGIKNPVLKLARDMVAAGELGEIVGFRGIHAEDFMADPDVPDSWRVDPSGALFGWAAEA